MRRLRGFRSLGLWRAGKMHKFLLEGVSALAPGVEASLERAHADDAPALQEQRHTGAGSLVRSSAIEHHVAVARDFLMALVELVRAHVDGARQFDPVGLKLG